MGGWWEGEEMKRKGVKVGFGVEEWTDCRTSNTKWKEKGVKGKCVGTHCG